jgi:hypothetical protein
MNEELSPESRSRLIQLGDQMMAGASEEQDVEARIEKLEHAITLYKWAIENKGDTNNGARNL